MDDQSIQHTKWNCTYHIVFIPKYRRKVLYGTNKKDIAEIIKKLCDMKGDYHSLPVSSQCLCLHEFHSMSTIHGICLGLNDE